jgi:hypothetical protein
MIRPRGYALLRHSLDHSRMLQSERNEGNREMRQAGIVAAHNQFRFE